MNPAFLFGTAFNIAYWHRKYHSGTICKGVSNPQTSNAFTGCEKEEIPKCVPRLKDSLFIKRNSKKVTRGPILKFLRVSIPFSPNEQDIDKHYVSMLLFLS